MKTIDSESYAERQFYAQCAEEREQRTFPKLPAGLAAFPAALLLTNVFAACRSVSGYRHETLRVRRHDSVDAETTGSVEYRGPALGQFHKRVLLGLLEAAGGQQGDVSVTLNTSELLQMLGRDTSTNSRRALQDALTDLRAATFVVRSYDSQRGQVFGFVQTVDWDRTSTTVRLDSRVLAVLHGHQARTYLPTARRRSLSDGVQTALADLVLTASEQTFGFDEVASLWGLEPHECARNIRSALPRLQAAGIIESYSVRRGRFTATKAPRF